MEIRDGQQTGPGPEGSVGPVRTPRYSPSQQTVKALLGDTPGCTGSGCLAPCPPRFAYSPKDTKGNMLPASAWFSVDLPPTTHKHHFFQVNQAWGNESVFNCLLLLYHPPNRAVLGWEDKRNAVPSSLSNVDSLVSHKG